MKLKKERKVAEPGTDVTGEAKPKTGGWLRIVKGNRALTIVGGVALLSLGFGLGASNLIVNDAGATLDVAPEPGLITVPVSQGSLNNDVTIRADIGFADATDVTLNTASIQGPAIVTGAIPEAGTELKPLSVALEITGRPVIVLPGELPAFRTLTIGMSGPDVVQFKQAMQAIGINAGNPANDVFDATAANAVRALYERVGYPVPVGDGSDAVQAAERALADANRNLPQLLEAADDSIRMAERSQRDASNALGAWDAANNAYENAWNDWNRRNQEYQTCLANLPTPDPDPIVPAVTFGISTLDGVNTADTELCTSPGPQPTLERPAGSRVHLQESLDDANRSLDRARTARSRVEADHRESVRDLQRALDDAREGALPQLPLSEVLFLNNLPRRVDSVSVTRGETLTGVSMRVSGAVLQLRGSATEANARLLEVGGEAFFDLPGGGQHRAVIAEIKAPTDGGSRWNIEFTPDEMSPEQFATLQGSNVRVQIPVGATQGAVLYVPVSALTAGPGGEARLEVVTGDPRDGVNAPTRLVVVETGLSANGFVEVTPVGDTLSEGDLVVVGR